MSDFPHWRARSDRDVRVAHTSRTSSPRPAKNTAVWRRQLAEPSIATWRSARTAVPTPPVRGAPRPRRGSAPRPGSHRACRRPSQSTSAYADRPRPHCPHDQASSTDATVPDRASSLASLQPPPRVYLVGGPVDNIPVDAPLHGREVQPGDGRPASPPSDVVAPAVRIRGLGCPSARRRNCSETIAQSARRGRLRADRRHTYPGYQGEKARPSAGVDECVRGDALVTPPIGAIESYRGARQLRAAARA
jgi:hypothetical protein